MSVNAIRVLTIVDWARCIARPVSWIASSVIIEPSHVSINTITQQFRIFLCADMVSVNSSILLGSDHAFATKRLGNGGLCGSCTSLACTPALQPHFYFLSLCRLHRLPAGTVIPGGPGSVTISVGKSWWSKIQLNCTEPMSISSCRLYFILR